MKQIVKHIIKTLTPNSLKIIYESDIRKRYEEKYKYINLSFAQEGEDLILNRFFKNKQIGFFVDVGAHHPIRFSNTYKFYLMGWRGINIDAMPGSMKSFNEIRPGDINLEIPVSESSDTLTYYIFNEPALNTFSKTEALRKDGLNNYKIIDGKKLKTQRLDSILDKYLPKNQQIDFFTIDVEGMDFFVLKSNNWEKYSPNMVLVEDLQSDFESVFSADLYFFMKTKGYKFVARTYNTLFFKLI